MAIKFQAGTVRQYTSIVTDYQFGTWLELEKVLNSLLTGGNKDRACNGWIMPFHARST